MPEDSWVLQAEELCHPMIKVSSAGKEKKIQLEKSKASFEDMEKEVLFKAVAMLCWLLGCDASFSD